MAKHNNLGKAGEDAAAKLLESEGYTIRHRNWRLRHLELDIVAEKDGELTIVEVKTRSNTDYRQPYEAVDYKKIKHILYAANAYIKEFDVSGTVHFDIITVVGDENKFNICHITDAFYPNSF